VERVTMWVFKISTNNKNKFETLSLLEINPFYA